MQEFKVRLPGSKSISLRSLILAALATGTSRLWGLTDCDDVEEMKSALALFGVVSTGSREDLMIAGIGGKLSGKDRDITLGLSGTSTRFLLALSALSSGSTTIDGRPSLRDRPNSGLVAALKALGCEVSPEGASRLPLTVTGSAALRSSVSVDGSLSSQFVSALMQIGPCIPNGLRIEIEGALVSFPYLQVTTREMAKFGVHALWEGREAINIPAGTYRSTEVHIEGDASAASYFAALAMIHGTTVVLSNLGSETVQGDYRFLELCEQLGGRIARTLTDTRITGPGIGQFRPVERSINMENMPDVAPTMMILAPFVPGGLRIEGLSTLRHKECDRIAIPATHLRALGSAIEEGDDYIVIPQTPLKSTSVPLGTYHDHRIAMSFGVLGTVVAGIEILDPACVSKTYPRFWEELSRFRQARSPVV